MNGFEFDILITTLWVMCGCIMYDKNRSVAIGFFAISIGNAISAVIILILSMIMKGLH